MHPLSQKDRSRYKIRFKSDNDYSNITILVALSGGNIANCADETGGVCTTCDDGFFLDPATSVCIGKESIVFVPYVRIINRKYS